MERIQKILSRAGIASRRRAERLMREGRVSVNGATVRELGTRADSARDEIRVDGRRIRMPVRRRYILLNKPRGYVTTRADPQRRPTVLDLLGPVADYVYPVGRLDYDSEGLVLLTNDGDLAARLTHPRHGVPRVYEVRVLGLPDQHDLKRLRRGVIVEGVRTQPADVRILDSMPASGTGSADRSARRRQGRATLEIILREGRRRQVRQMCDAIGHPVEHLRRTAIGPITDRRLKPGQWRDLTRLEIRRLQAAAGVPAR